MKNLKKLAKKAVPQRAVDVLHLPEALLYARKNHFPAKSMIVVGVVGSKGKTTISNMIWAVLSASGAKVGQIGTANIRIGEKEELNKYHMTMPGPAALQSILAQMRRAGCKYVVMEVPSEGQAQWRHVGIDFDVLVFTNVEREIMASHRGSMAVLHEHNERVFKTMAKAKNKVINGQKIPKIIIANSDSEYARAYSNFRVDRVTNYSVKKDSPYQAKEISSNNSGVDFTLNDQKYHTNVMGEVNAENAAAAIAVGHELGLDVKTIQAGLQNLKTIPGRMEPIDEGQNFTVLVDYAHSPASMEALMRSAKAMAKGKIITLLGSEGGGRDVEKRAIMGRQAGETSDFVVVSNVDPYEDDPQTIIEDVAKGARESGKKDDKDLFLVEDRRAGIAKALELAGKDDLVLITGKGAEQSIVIDGKSTPWDDRKVVAEELKKL